VEQAFLVLDPGRYVAHYESDGSHSFDDWNRDMPSNPERWGLTIFLLNGVDNGVVRVVESAEAGTATSDASGTASGTGPGPASGTIAVQVGASPPSSTD
jgi:hypothetical protein